MEQHIFEVALFNKVRFSSVRGELTLEQLFDVPLTAHDDFSLDAIARKVSAELRAVSEESFVNVKPNPARSTLELQLECCKLVIALREAVATKAASKAKRRAERAALLDALDAAKQRAASELTAFAKLGLDLQSFKKTRKRTQA